MMLRSSWSHIHATTIAYFGLISLATLAFHAPIDAQSGSASGSSNATTAAGPALFQQNGVELRLREVERPADGFARLELIAANRSELDQTLTGRIELLRGSEAVGSCRIYLEVPSGKEVRLQQLCRGSGYQSFRLAEAHLFDQIVPRE